MTKPSSRRKFRASRGRNHSKLSLLRKKLSLGVKKYPIIQAESSNTVQEAVAVQNAQTVKTFHRTSPMKLVRLYKSMTPEQVTLIKSWGYRGLVEIQCSILQPDLCKFLMNSFDPSSCKLVFSGRGSIDVTEASIQEVIGVPRGDIDVRYEMDADVVSFMNQQLGNARKLQPKISFLEKKLAAMKTADTTYLRLFITYAMCFVIAATTGTRLSPRVFPSLVRIKQCHGLNMIKFIISMLSEAARSKEEEGIMKSCQLFFMVKYLHSLELKDMDINPEGTRVSAWTNAMVKKSISQDQRSDGTFGLAPLKAQFASYDLNEEATQQQPESSQDAEHGINNTREVGEEEEPNDFPIGEESQGDEQTDCSIVFSDAEKIEMFIGKNAPPNRTSEETQRYKQAV